MIRNASTNQFRAVSGLQSLIRWCLTGTPIQNSLDDLGSLITFLRLPFLSEATQFRRHITRRTSLTQSKQQPDYESLRLLLGAICLRRNKAILPVPQSDEHVYNIEFSWREREQYERLAYSWREALDLAVSGHKPKDAHQTVLEALLRMRIFCNNGDFFGNGHASLLTDPDEMGSILQQSDKVGCRYCSCDVLSFGHADDSSSGFVTACHFAVCGGCLVAYREFVRKYGSCPICNVRHQSQSPVRSQYARSESQKIYQFPPKLITLCEDIGRHRNESKR